MVKRLFWLLLGMGFGFGLALRLMRAVRQTVDRYSPPRALRRFREDVRSAVAEGREGMRQREEELWAELDGRHRALPNGTRGGTGHR